jgi:hypothetical protein
MKPKYFNKRFIMILREFSEFSFQEEIGTQGGSHEQDTFECFPTFIGGRIRTPNFFSSKVQIFVFDCVNKGLKMK